MFVSNAMEQIEEVLSPAVRREIEGEPALIDRSRFIDRKALARQTRQKLAAAQDLNFSGRMQALQRLVCMPSSQDQEADLQLAVEGDTDLHTAIRKKDTDSFSRLLLQSQGADINTCNARGDTPLLLAMQADRAVNFILALFKYTPDVNVKNAAGFPALYYAIKKNECGCIDILLRHGADPNFVDEDGNTLLHIAAQANAFLGIPSLVRYKLNPNQLNKYNLTPLHIAILKNFRSTSYQILCFAHADPNTPIAGESLLIFAIRNELLWLIQALVENGADVEAKDALGNSALDLALTRCDNTPIMYALLRRGANPNVKDASGDTPLARALKNSDIDAARTLIEYQANPNMPDSNGVMPIFHVLRLGNGIVYCACLLIERGADPHVRDAEDNTPLHLAVSHENVVNLLIQHGARVDAVNRHGDTPLHCVESMTPRSAYVLRSYGADINLKNNEGLTPYEKARRYCLRGGSLDGRLLLILEPARSYRLLNWYPGEQPKTPLARAEDYGISSDALPGLPETQSSSVVPEHKPLIEYVYDDDGQAAAASAQAPETSERAQEPQPRNPVFAGNVCTCWQLWDRAVAYFYPWVSTAKQSHDSAQSASSSEQAAVSPVTVADEEPASCIGSDHHTTSTLRHRFLAQSQP